MTDARLAAWLNRPLLLEESRANAIIALTQKSGAEAPPDPKAFFWLFDYEERDDLDVRDGIAVVPVSRGISSYRMQALRRRMERALERSDVAAILLDVNSPGGEVCGTFDFTDWIRAQRGSKPIWALANDDAFSAAYAIASAADRVLVTRTGGVGSIGVISIHAEYSKMDDRVGVKITPIFSGARKNDFADSEPLTDTARGVLQAEVDRLRDIFVETVAANRGIDAKAVRATEAGLFFGPQGVEAKLADQVASFDEAMAALREVVAGRTNTRRSAAGGKGMSDETTETQGKEKPEATAGAPEKGAQVIDLEAAKRAARDEGAAQAQQAEKDRRAGVAQMLKLAGCPERLGEFLDTDLTPEQVGKKLLDERAAKSGPELSNQHSAGTGGDAAKTSINTQSIYEARRKAVRGS